jgi:hypothetical protein
MPDNPPAVGTNAGTFSVNYGSKGCLNAPASVCNSLARSGEAHVDIPKRGGGIWYGVADERRYGTLFEHGFLVSVLVSVGLASRGRI